MRKAIMIYNITYVIGLYIYPHNTIDTVRITGSFAQFLEYDQTLIFFTSRCDSIVYTKIKSSDSTYLPAKVIGVPQHDSDLYTLQLVVSQDMFTIPDSRISPYDPHTSLSDALKHRDSILPSWINNKTPTTIFTNGMQKPKRGTLVKHQDSS